MKINKLILTFATTLYALTIFSNGFFLRRKELSNKNNFSDWSKSKMHSKNSSDLIDSDFHNFLLKNGYLKPCQNPPRALFVLIDGVRTDFVMQNYQNESRSDKLYNGAFNVLSKIAMSEKNNSKLFRFVADSPTVTNQRVKALLTGGYPTFIEFKDNFNTKEIKEDTLITQLYNSNRTVVMLGDGIWENFFKDVFKRHYFYPSLDIFDWTTVDDGIDRNLFNELDKNDWDAIFLHYVGVDHVGHSLKLNHPEMKKMLLKFNSTVTKIINRIKKMENTIMFIYGDHGMVESGNHGGDSDDEKNTFLFTFLSNDLKFEKFFNYRSDFIYQTSLAPIASNLLCIPSPYSSIGTLLPDFFYSHKNPSKSPKISKINKNNDKINKILPKKLKKSPKKSKINKNNDKINKILSKKSKKSKKSPKNKKINFITQKAIFSVDFLLNSAQILRFLKKYQNDRPVAFKSAVIDEKNALKFYTENFKKIEKRHFQILRKIEKFQKNNSQNKYENKSENNGKNNGNFIEKIGKMLDEIVKEYVELNQRFRDHVVMIWGTFKYSFILEGFLIMVFSAILSFLFIFVPFENLKIKKSIKIATKCFFSPTNILLFVLKKDLISIFDIISIFIIYFLYFLTLTALNIFKKKIFKKLILLLKLQKLRIFSFAILVVIFIISQFSDNGIIYQKNLTLTLFLISFVLLLFNLNKNMAKISIIFKISLIIFCLTILDAKFNKNRNSSIFKVFVSLLITIINFYDSKIIKTFSNSIPLLIYPIFWLINTKFANFLTKLPQNMEKNNFLTQKIKIFNILIGFFNIFAVILSLNFVKNRILSNFRHFNLQKNNTKLKKFENIKKRPFLLNLQNIFKILNLFFPPLKMLNLTKKNKYETKSDKNLTKMNKINNKSSLISFQNEILVFATFLAAILSGDHVMIVVVLIEKIAKLAKITFFEENNVKNGKNLKNCEKIRIKFEGFFNGWLFYLIAVYLYNLMGNDFKISSIDYTCAYYFFGFNFTSKILVFIKVYLGYFIAICGLLQLSKNDKNFKILSKNAKNNEKTAINSTKTALLAFNFWSSIKSLASLINVFFQRRNLLLPDIFAPKFLFDMFSSFFVSTVILFIMALISTFKREFVE